MSSIKVGLIFKADELVVRSYGVVHVNTVKRIITSHQRLGTNRNRFTFLVKIKVERLDIFCTYTEVSDFYQFHTVMLANTLH